MDTDAPVSNYAAVRLTIGALKLTDESAALRVAAEQLAAAVDTWPDNANLWAQYQKALAALLAAGEQVDVDADRLSDAVRSAALNIAVIGSADGRRGGGGDGGGDGATPHAVAASRRGRGTRASA